MMDSILDSIKKSLGIDPESEVFDVDIILHINTTLMILNQLGVGEPLSIADNSEEWDDFFGDRTDLEGVKSYIYLKVRLLFDPPTSAALVEVMERQVRELEWRLNIQGEETEE